MNYSKAFKTIVNRKTIPDAPLDRITAPVKTLLKGKYAIDVHTHFFDIKTINYAYLILRLAKDRLRLKSDSGFNQTFPEIEEIYNDLNIKDDEDWVEKLKDSLENDPESPLKKKGLGTILSAIHVLLFSESPSDIYNYYIDNFSLAQCFPHLNKDQVLTTGILMDLKVGWNVPIKKSYRNQIDEMYQLSQKKPVLPFLFCHPNRLKNDATELYELFNYAFTEKQFFGVKLYPALGYHPNDHRLWPIYELCQEKGIPVLTHCGGNTISIDKNYTRIYNGEGSDFWGELTRLKLANRLNDPLNWVPVLKKFPELKLNIAHFGGNETWEYQTGKAGDLEKRKDVIIGLMTSCSNVYADFSYNIATPKLNSALLNKITLNPLLQKRTMFGSDFWMVLKEGDLQKKQSDFLKDMDESNPELELSQKLTLDNPYKYLFG